MVHRVLSVPKGVWKVPIDGVRTTAPIIQYWIEHFRPKEIVRDEWYFNPQFMDYVKLRVDKGDEMSKRTEISYRNLKNDTVEFVGYKNVMTLADIDMEIGAEARAQQYADGRCYYRIPSLEEEDNGIRIWNRREKVLGKDYVAGKTYSSSDWHFFIDFLLEAGERYGEIKADLKASEVQKILI